MVKSAEKALGRLPNSERRDPTLAALKSATVQRFVTA